MSNLIPQWLIPSDAGARRELASRLATLSICLILASAGILLWQFQRRQAKDPFESPQFKTLKARLAADPKNETLKVQIRELDLQLRTAFFHQRSFAERGALLLILGAVVALVCGRWLAVLDRRPPLPKVQLVGVDPDVGRSRLARRAVVAFTLVLAAVVYLLSRSFASELPRSEDALAALLAPPLAPELAATDPAAPAPTAAVAQTSAPAPTAAGAADAAKQWPRFRGPDGCGVAVDAKAPTAWDAAAGKNIAWKSPVPLPGNNSPILWNGKLFMSGADEQKRQVYCFDAESGKLLWKQDVPVTPTGQGKVKVMEDTGYAASTMATDGRGVYAMFPNGDVAAFDLDGKQLWLRGFGIPKNDYGHATSLATYKNTLLVQIDQADADAHLSKLMALDGATGKTVWETPRNMPASWCTPLVINAAGRDQVITGGDPFVTAYNPADGKEIWRAKCLKQDVGPSPVFSAGLVFMASEFPCLTAIKPDGTGDVTATHCVWKGEDGLPDTCSPLGTDKYLLLLTTSGTLTCYAAKDGKKLWEKDFDSEFRASPSMAGGKVYLIGAEGKCWVVELGDEGCKEVGAGALGEKCVASPVFHASRMYLRGAKNLYCIGEK